MFQGAKSGFSYLLIQMIAPYLVGGRDFDKIVENVQTSDSNLC